MQIPPHVKNNPNYTLLAHYFEPEEVVRIVESRIPINRPGIVPSLQVPPGAKDCDQIPVMDMDGMGRVFDPRTAMGNVDWMANVPLIQAGTPVTRAEDQWWGMLPSLFSPPPTVTGGQPPLAPRPPDTALAWVNDNWLLIAGSLVGLLALSTLTKK